MPAEAADPKASYDQHGYVVWRNLVPAPLIDALLELYAQEIVPSRSRFFRQNRGRYERNQVTSHGFVKQSFLDVHDYGGFHAFSEAALEIYTSDEVQAALHAITGASSLNLMQSMLFDANTETQPHQDWWYLDSVPAGHLLAVWFALEDIHETAGRFYVLSDTMDLDLREGDVDLPHKTWLARMREYADAHVDRIVVPALRKGDAIFWNSRTVHGSLPTTDPRHSRKSLTAHYLPSDRTFGNLFKVKDYISYKDYHGVKHFKNQPDYTPIYALRNWVKLLVYDHPRALRLLRLLQRH